MKVKFPSLNLSQRWGLAKVADNVATACIVTVLLGGFSNDEKVGVSKVGSGIAFLLVSFAVVLVLIAMKLRAEGDDNGD